MSKIICENCGKQIDVDDAMISLFDDKVVLCKACFEKEEIVFLKAQESSKQ